MKDIQIIFRPRFDELESVPVTENKDCLKMIEKYSDMLSINPQPDPEMDYEDWVEANIQLIEAVETGLPVSVLSRGKKTTITHKINTIEDPSKTKKTILIGSILNNDPFLQGFSNGNDIIVNKNVDESILNNDPFLQGFSNGNDIIVNKNVDESLQKLNVVWPNVKEAELAQKYYKHTAFIMGAGRWTQVCGLPEEGSEDIHLFDAMLKRAKNTDRDFMVKIISKDKYMPVFEMNVKADSDQNDLEKQLFQKMEYNVLQFDGISDCFLLQEKAEMQYECRVAVVDGKIASLAGAVESDTPINNNSESISGRFEKTRNDGKTITDIEIAYRFYDEASIFLDDLMKPAIPVQDWNKWLALDSIRLPNDDYQHPGFKSFILDLCIIDDYVHIIEINPILSYGLYSMNYKSILEKIIRSISND